jgi:Tfp pilus assembly protein PilF
MSPRFLVLVSLFVAIGLGSSRCSRCSPTRAPETPPAVYREAVTAFYVGLSAMQTTQEVLARQKFDRVVALVPQEPAGWANLGLLLLRQQDLDQGAAQLARAAELAPDSAAVQKLLALADSRRGKLPEAIAYWRRALQLDSHDREAAYALALEIERQAGPDSDAEAQRVLEQLLGRSDNLAARLEFMRIAAKRGDAAALKAATAPLAEISSRWPPEAQEHLNTLMTAAAENPRAAAVRVTFLKNTLLRDPVYRAALADVSTPRAEVGQPIERFLRLPNPESQPAAPDQALTFKVEPLPDARPGAWWVGAIWPPDGGNPTIATAGPSAIHLAGTAVDSRCQPVASGNSGTAVADLNYDFRGDLVFAGPAGLCLLRNADGGFADVTALSTLPPAVLRSAARAVWPADIDTDGDLDLVLALRDAAPLVLRNNGDGTFIQREVFPGVTRARAFAWADFDGEGVPDAAFLDEAGVVHLFANLRGGAFRAEKLPAGLGPALAIAALELNGDALVDLLVLTRAGGIVRFSRNTLTNGWESMPVTALETPGATEPGTAHLLTGDLDNNGVADLIVSTGDTARVLLGATRGFLTLKTSVPLNIREAVDLDGDGRLELIGLGSGGVPSKAVIAGSKSYRWQVVRPRAATATGDQRINSFGIGGEIEVRSGLHLQKQVIAAPAVHFGLGEANGAELVRIIWPNGAPQAEYDAKANQVVTATQRLKGSCPWLFAWNGREMSFVTDVLWRSPLGLRINAQATAETLMTEDWVKVRGDQLVAKNGAYDLRITAELWETHFFDHTSLLVVDHPADTEIFVDERFVVPAPKLAFVATGPVQRFASVRDDRGRDVSALAADADSRHVDFAGRGPYQGVTRPHYVEVELPDNAPRTGPLWLVARGWIHPTDSSINVAIAQGAHAAPEGLSLHVADARGRFHEVRGGLGFPAGKDKTILIDLTNVFASSGGASGTRRFRLATNLEIFWDTLGWAVGRPDVLVHTRRLEVSGADLVYRGYSVVEQPSPSVPERPRYVLEGTGQRWRDLEGYHTRFGDVKDLLRSVDDRYVIMNAGDELRLRFPETSAPAPGHVRNFIMIADGWEKDGDFNTSFSRTVLPLPTHRTGKYETPPRTLEEDPIHRQHPNDFAEYHTRYVTGDRFRDALQRTRQPSNGTIPQQ